MGVVNNSSSTKLSYSEWKNAVLNPSKSFLALKRSTLGFFRLLKDRSLKKMGKTLSSHIIHSLGGEYCWIVRDSEPVRLLKSPRSLSVYILIMIIIDNNQFINMWTIDIVIFYTAVCVAWKHWKRLCNRLNNRQREMPRTTKTGRPARYIDLARAKSETSVSILMIKAIKLK